MLRALRVEHAGNWPRDSVRGTVTLSHDDRHCRRQRLTSDAGETFLLDLPHATRLREGDGLELSNGAWFEVRAARETLMEVTAKDCALLPRLAWHLGNRHLPAQIERDRILIRADHVILAMLERLGATLRMVDAAFTPERGAYDGTGEHHQSHDTPPHRHD